MQKILLYEKIILHLLPLNNKHGDEIAKDNIKNINYGKD